MTKSFKKNLLSTASMLAVVATAAIPTASHAVISVSTGKTITNDDTLTDGADFTVNSTTLNVSQGVALTDTADPTVDTASFTGVTLNNYGTITGVAGQFAVDADAINFSLNNEGTIDGTTAVALQVGAASNAAFTNSGTISTAGSATSAVDINAALTHTSGFVNSGLITSDVNDGIDLGASFVKLNNSGSITTTGVTTATDAAVKVSATATGDIVNSGTIASTLLGAGNAIEVNAVLTGDITNSGSISALAGEAIDLNETITTLTNSSTGTISSVSGDFAAVAVTDAKNLNLTNSGSISSNGNVGTVFYAGSHDSDITNSGTIQNLDDGSAIDITTNLTGFFLNNTGGIVSSATGLALDFGGTVSETITNKGTIRTTGGTAAAVNVDGAVAKLFTNSGTITSKGGIGIDLDADLTVGLTNTGTITGAGVTIDADADLTALTNSGSTAVISSTGGATQAIDFFATQVVTLTNTGGATITASGSADTINFAGAAPTGVIKNESGSLISNTGTGSAINFATGVIAGSITNAGTISVVAGGTAIQLDDASSVIDSGITNSGTIDAGVTGVAIDYSTGVVAGDDYIINNSGTIIGALQLGGNAGETNTVSLTGGSITTQNASDTAILGTAAVDTITISGGTQITGIINGVSGNDIVNFGLTGTSATDSFTTGGAIINVLTVNVDYGTLNVGHDIGVTGTALTNFDIDAGATVNVTESVTLDNADLVNLGTLNVNAGKTFTLSGGAADTINLTSGTLKFGVNDATTFGKLAADGAVTIATSTLSADFSGTTKYIPTGTILTDVLAAAGGGSNTDFTTFTSSSPTFTISENATSDGTGLDVLLTRVTYQTNSSEQNDKNVGTALEAIGTAKTGDAALGAVLGSLDGSASTTALRSNLESLNPENSGANNQAVLATQNAAVGTVETQLASYRDAEASGIATGGMFNERAVWGQVFGSTAEQDNRDGVKGYEADTTGFAFGADTNVTDKDRVGISVAYAVTEVEHERNSASSTDVDSFQIAAYGTHDEDKWYIDGLLGVTFNSFDQTRTLTVGANKTATADYDGTQITAKAKAGYKHSLNNGVNLTPTLSLQYTNSSVDTYTETGSSANLTVDSDDTSVFESGLGIKASYPITHGKAVLTPEVHAEWKYDFIGDEYEATNNFTSVSGTTFVSQGADVAQNTFVLGAGLDILAQDNVTVSFGYDGAYKEDYSSHSASLKARVEF